MSKQNITVLIVDDDQGILDNLQEFFQCQHINSFIAKGGEAMWSILKLHSIDIIVLDVMMPGEDGFTLCRKLREKSQMPIIMLTAAGEDNDRILGLELGADDYLAKPFNPRELMARIKTILRRAQTDSSEQQIQKLVYKFSDWTLNKAMRLLTSPDNVEVDLSAGDYNLLLTFLEHPQHVLTRDQLMDFAKNRQPVAFDRSIDIQVSRLRYKIEADPKQPKLIKTVRGGGYMFTEDVIMQ